MRISRFSCVWCVLAIAAPTALARQHTWRASVTSSGAQANGHSWPSSISSDGRYVAFLSNAPVFGGPGSTQSYYVALLHDNVTGATERIDLDSNGQPALPACDGNTQVSTDGRYVAFRSSSHWLIANDTNGHADIFVRDRQLGTTTRVSVSSTGVESLWNSQNASMTPDGALVAFDSGGRKHVLGDNNLSDDVFVHEMATGATTRVSVDSAGVEGNSHSRYPAISADGRFVAFASAAANLVAGDNNGAWDVFVHDRQTGVTEIASVSSAGIQGVGSPQYWMGPAISGDGHRVVFLCPAADLTALPYRVLVRDRATSQTFGVDDLSIGAPMLIQGLQGLTISADGERVAFASSYVGFAGDVNGINTDIFVRDIASQTTSLESLGPTGVTGNQPSYRPALSADGRFITFTSLAWDLVPDDTNDFQDIFVRDTASYQPTPYCTASVSTGGCTPAWSWNGAPSASATWGWNVRLSGLDRERAALIFYGLAGRTAGSWGGTSFLCVKPPVQRTDLQSTGGVNACDGAIALDWRLFLSDHPTAFGNPLAVGAVVDAQCWYRDPPAPKTTNLSGALEFTIVP